MQDPPPPSSTPPSTPPPPPQPKNTRRHPRFEMFASVELHADEETMVLPARNISLGGAYLTADGHDLGRFEVGMELEVLVFDALNEQRKPAKLVGEIVRHDGDGLALMWADSDPDIAIRLVQLLDQLQPRTSPE